MKLNKLRGKRVENEMSQAQVASALGMSEVSYWRKENGIREFSRTEIDALAKTLNLKDNEIIEIFFGD